MFSALIIDSFIVSVIVLGVILGFVFEDKLIVFEDKIISKFRKK